jgi:hypothetical protein
MSILKISVRPICTLNSLVGRLQPPISKKIQPKNESKLISTYRTQKAPHNVSRPDEIQQNRENGEDPEEKIHWKVDGFFA